MSEMKKAPTAKEFQNALIARGWSLAPYGADGDIGPTTLTAAMEALEQYVPLVEVAEEPELNPIENVIPVEWMPWCKMLRIIVHWTAGGNVANGVDKDHYHIIIEGDGKVLKGKHTIDDNMSTSDGDYAAHTYQCNTQSIAVSLCGMLHAKESPFDPGPQPITVEQWEMLPRVLSDLCRRYNINVDRHSVLSHAEVQKTLGVAQKGKWDIARLPWDNTAKTAFEIGDRFRADTKAILWG